MLPAGWLNTSPGFSSLPIPYTRCVDRNFHETSVSLLIYILIFFRAFFGPCFERFIPDVVITLGIEKYVVCHVSVLSACVVLRITFFPCDAVAKIFRTENFVHYDLYVKNHFCVKMHVYRAIIGQQRPQENEALT